jgi:hypothetical protein
MDTTPNLIIDQTDSPVRGRRFLRIFACLVVVTALIVASVNLVSYRYMLRENNHAIVQLLAGWGRMYKPILYDEIKPNVAVYGASWARDAFDPIETGRLLGKSVFNHAVSGGTAYETRRFGDSSLDNINLQTAIINLNTFYRSKLAAKARYGFDESILDTDPEGNPNHWVGLKRNYSLALAGWAVGANLKLISTIIARDRGAARPDYLRSYEQANHTRRQGRMDEARRRIFPAPGQAELAAPEPDKPDAILMSEELGLMIDGFCEHGVDVYAYFTPSHVRQQSCDDALATEELVTLEYLRAKQASCKAKIRFFDFGYPNAVTLEGVVNPVKASLYYRPDGHPRPTMGLLMAASMFERDYPSGTPDLIRQDFGVDLLSYPDGESWLQSRARRCAGDWGDQGFADFLAALTSGE